MDINEAGSTTVRIPWRILLLLICLGGAGIWIWSGWESSDSLRERFYADFHQEDLHWWGQYLALPMHTISAFELEQDLPLEERLTQRESLFQGYAEQLPELIEAEPDPVSKASLEALAWYLDLQLRGKKYVYHSFPLNPFSGAVLTLALDLEFRYPIHSVEEATEFVGKFPSYAEQLLRYKIWIDRQQQAGLLPPQSLIERSIRQLDTFVGYELTAHPIYRSFGRSLVKLPATSINEYQATDLLIQLSLALQQQLYPACLELRNYLSELKTQAPVEVGVGRLPEGRSYYQYCLEYYVGKEADPSIIRELAVREVRALDQILGQLDLNQEREQTIPLQLAKEATEEMRMKTRGIFSHIPSSGPHIQSIPAIWEEYGPSVAYVPATLMASEKAAFFVNPRPASSFSGWESTSNAYAYSIPGLHLAENYREKADLRHTFSIPSWQQGWAWYAASLPVTDLRLLTNRPLAYAGYLQSRRKIAALALLDVNLHTLTWKREEGIAYLVKTIGMEEASATLEVDRAVATPGMACAPLIGEIKFQQIRSEVMDEMEQKLSLKEFHDWILRLGPLPFDLLDVYVEKFLQLKVAN